MMDEFEMFRARAYGGGLGDCSGQGFLKGNDDEEDDNEESSMLAAMRSKSKRRHSSVGIVRSGAEPYASLGMAAALSNHDPSRNAGFVARGSEEGGGFSDARWRNKPRLPSQVTVAIEPPSPTDPYCDDYGHLQPRPKHYQHQQAIDDEDDEEDYDEDEECLAKTHYRPGRQNLQRTHTAPPHIRTPSPKRHGIDGGSQRRLEDYGRTVSAAAAAAAAAADGRGGVEAISSHMSDSCDDGGSRNIQANDDATGETRRRSPSVQKGRPGSKGDQGQRRDSRPDNLRLTAPSPGGVGGGGGSIPRRKSVTCVTDGLHLTQPSPSAHRRNSYTGAISLKPSSPPSGAGFNIGRRGSAITYLTDGPVTGLGWKQPSPGGSPSRRKSCFEDIGRDAEQLLGGRTTSTGGLNLDEIRNHLEDLTRAAADAVAGNGSKVNSRTSSINHKTSNRPSIAGSPSGGGSGSTTDSSECPPVYRVMVLGGQGVGKTTLANQLMTSEYLANKENNQDVVDPEHMVCVRLDDEVSMVHIVELTADERDYHQPTEEVDAYLVVYSVTDRLSFSYAQSSIQNISRAEPRSSSTVIVLVANKHDLVRNRTISTSEGKRFALKRRCKFLEVSALLDHKVDEVLVALIRECRSRQRKLDWENFGDVSDDDLGCLSRMLEICSKICK